MKMLKDYDLNKRIKNVEIPELLSTIAKALGFTFEGNPLALQWWDDRLFIELQTELLRDSYDRGWRDSTMVLRLKIAFTSFDGVIISRKISVKDGTICIESALKKITELKRLMLDDDDRRIESDRVKTERDADRYAHEAEAQSSGLNLGRSSWIYRQDGEFEFNGAIGIQ